MNWFHMYDVEIMSENETVYGNQWELRNLRTKPENLKAHHDKDI